MRAFLCRSYSPALLGKGIFCIYAPFVASSLKGPECLETFRAIYKCLAAYKSCNDIPSVGFTRGVQSYVPLRLLLYLAQIFFLLLAAAVRVLQ